MVANLWPQVQYKCDLVDNDRKRVFKTTLAKLLGLVMCARLKVVHKVSGIKSGYS